jgi:hypothetical protein
MNSISTNTLQNATIKKYKSHCTQPAIARKLVAFEELINLERQKKSAREAAHILEIPNSTMQSWRKPKISQEAPIELTKFFLTPTGADFLQRNTIAVMKLMKCGPSGIRGMQEYLHNSGLDKFIASSEGALQSFWERCENYILHFGQSVESKLAPNMKFKKITAVLDEMFRSNRPCLVAIEALSNYILLEKFTEDRKAETWTKELAPRIETLNVTLTQVVSDLCGGIRASAKKLGAKHIPDLFHAIYEVSKATSAPLAAHERGLEKGVVDAQEKLNKAIIKYGKESLKTEEAEGVCNLKKLGLKWSKERREQVRAAKKELGQIHHPIELQTGRLQTEEIIKHKIDKQLDVIEVKCKEACLSDSSIKRLEKARRAFDSIVEYMNFFYLMYFSFVLNLKLDPLQESFFNEVIFPLCYLRSIWKRQSKQAKEKMQGVLNGLESRLKEGPWSDELKNQWLGHGQELAQLFQRSSSCVEGRNGVLSLNHHRFHRLNPRSLKVLTIIHNFDARRKDGSTAAERFFGAKHENLFEFLVANVRIPGRAKKQYHDLKKRQLGREKRREA